VINRDGKSVENYTLSAGAAEEYGRLDIHVLVQELERLSNDI